MNFIASRPGKSRLVRVLAMTLLLSALALQSGFATGAVSIAPETTAVTPSHKVKSFHSYKPFSKLAIGTNFGTLGPTLELATPLTRRTNLRVDGSFFDYGLSGTQNGVNYNGTLNMRDARVSLDFFPFGGSFRISGGIAAYNKLDLGASGVVSTGNSISLDDTDYYSDPSNPLHGSASFAYGRKFAPTVTMGWGNAIPRTGHHLSFPFEFGAAFTGTPTVNLNFVGSACTDTTYTSCGDVTTFSDFQTDLAAQLKKIVNDVAPLRVYPILNMGVDYRF